MRPDKFIDNIKRAIMPDVKKQMPDMRLGTVASVSGTIAQVIIDGDTKPTPMTAFCAAAPGARALVLKQGTQFYLTGVTGDSISQSGNWTIVRYASGWKKCVGTIVLSSVAFPNARGADYFTNLLNIALPVGLFTKAPAVVESCDSSGVIARRKLLVEPSLVSLSYVQFAASTTIDITTRIVAEGI